MARLASSAWTKRTMPKPRERPSGNVAISARSTSPTLRNISFKTCHVTSHGSCTKHADYCQHTACNHSPSSPTYVADVDRRIVPSTKRLWRRLPRPASATVGDARDAAAVRLAIFSDKDLAALQFRIVERRDRTRRLFCRLVFDETTALGASIRLLENYNSQTRLSRPNGAVFRSEECVPSA
jgi:hypothetical protein